MFLKASRAACLKNGEMEEMIQKIREGMKAHFFLLFLLGINAYMLMNCFVGDLWLDVSRLVRYPIKLLIFLFIATVLGFGVKMLPSRQVQNQEPSSSGRETGMDLVRMVAALFVIAVHHVYFDGYYQEPLNHLSAYVATFIRWLFFCCVALYFTISGYFLRKRKPTMDHYKKLWKIIRAYIIVCVIIRLREGCVSIREWVDTFHDIVTFRFSGFLSQYVWLFLLIPFINMAWERLNKKERQVLLIISICMTSLYPNITFFIPAIFLQTYPITYYLLGAYIAEYRPKGNKKVLLAALLVWLFSISVGTIQHANGGVFDWSYLNATGHGYEMFPNFMVTMLVFLLCYDCGIPQKCISKFLAAVSRNSFEIFMFSCIMDGIVFRTLQRVDGLSFERKLLLLPVTVFSSFFLSLGASLLLNGILKRWDCKKKSLMAKRRTRNEVG